MGTPSAPRVDRLVDCLAARLAARRAARRAALLAGAALLLGGCGGGPPPPPPPSLDQRPAEWLLFEGDGRSWRLLDADRQPGYYLELLSLPPGSAEPVNSPTSSFSHPAPPRTERALVMERRLVFVPGGGSDRDVEQEVEAMRVVVAGCAASDFELLARGPGDAFFEWSHSGCPDRGPGHELARVVEGRLGVHRAALRAEGGRIPEGVRRDWLRILVGARLSGGR